MPLARLQGPFLASPASLHAPSCLFLVPLNLYIYPFIL